MKLSDKEYQTMLCDLVHADHISELLRAIVPGQHLNVITEDEHRRVSLLVLQWQLAISEFIEGDG